MKTKLIIKLFAFSLLMSFTDIFYGQTPFSPSDISGMKLWFIGDSCRLNPSLSIDTVYDISGNLNHAYQNSPSIKPTVSSTTLNNHKTILFDGIDDYVNFNTLSDIRTVFWVIRERPTSPNYRPLLGHSSLYDFHRGQDSIIWRNAINNVTSGITKLNQNIVDGITTYLNSKFYIISVVTTGNTSAENFASDRFSPGRNWDGNLAELIIYNQALTPSQVTQVENYLNNKYAPPVNLGPDLAYCSSPITLRVKKDYFKSYQWQDGTTNDSLVATGGGTYYVTTTDIFDRISSDTIIITQDTLAHTANLGNDTTICNGSQLILSAGPSYLTYLWSNGATTPTISINSQGNYSVTVTNCAGNSSTDLINISLRNLPSFNLGGDTTICYNSNFILDPGFTNSIPLTFDWYDSTHDSIHSVNTNGQYYLTVTDNIGCSYSDTVNIQIDASLTSISLGPDTNLCAGNAIYLKSGNQPGLSYTWNDGTYNDSLYVNTTGQYHAIVTNTNNCVANDTINVTIVGQAPTASFLNSVACKNNVIAFTDYSSPPSGNTISSWFWNFGDASTLADTSLLQNPFYTYADTGNYLVKLSVTTNVGCKQSFNKTIHVAPKPVANFNNILACQNDSTLFSNLSTTISGYGPLIYLWNFGDPTSGAANTSVLTNPKHLFSQQINYSVKLITSNNAGCKDSLTKNILVKAQVTADFTYSLPCTNTPITFQDNSIVPPPDNLNTRLWTIGTSTNTGLSVTKSFTTPGVYPITLKVTGFNSCISTVTKQIDVKLPPIPQFSLPFICYKDTGIAVDQSVAQNGSLTSWTWKLNNTIFSTTQSATLSPLATTNYQVRLIVTNSFNCKDSITKPFTVYPLPAVDFTTSPSTNFYPDSLITFGPTNPTAISYNWDINNTPYSIYSPTVSFPSPGTYTTSLSIKNSFGCTNTKTKTLKVVNYFIDLALLEIRTTKSNDNYITVEADIGNVGSAVVSNFEINYHITDAASIKEEWLGRLDPGGFLTYTFNSKAIQKNTEQAYITCVNLGLVNSISDFNQSNNKLCIASNLDEIIVYEPYPNPSEEQTTISVVLPFDSEVTFDVIDELGQAIYSNQVVSGKQGLNLITIPTSDLSRATYIVKITIDDKIFFKKFLKAKQ